MKVRFEAMSTHNETHAPSATIIGFGAIILWSCLATLTIEAGRIPPFEMTGMTFGFGALLGLVVAIARGRVRCLWPSWSVLLIGVSGLLGDYVLYFGALQLAPAAQASLIIQLWPLMMVLLAAVLLKERLHLPHFVGLALGLLAVALLTISTTNGMVFELRFFPGYAMAFGAATVWAWYSVISRRFADVPTETIASICFTAALLAGIVHWATEPTVLPEVPHQVFAIVAIGLGPAGGSFFLWDLGVKRGSVRMLAVLGLATPVLSMLMLVGTGFAKPTSSLLVACALVALSGVCATNIPWRHALGLRHGPFDRSSEASPLQ